MLLNDFLNPPTASSGVAIGQLVTGYFAHDSNYVKCSNTARYSAEDHPGVAGLIDSGEIPGFWEPYAMYENMPYGQSYDTDANLGACLIDGSNILIATPGSNVDGPMLYICKDGNGYAWYSALTKSKWLQNVGLPTTRMTVIGIQKGGADGHYGVIIAALINGGGSTLYFTTTTDYGVTWNNVVPCSGVGGSTATCTEDRVKMIYRNGVWFIIHLYAGAVNARYSLDDGVNWITMTGTNLTATLGIARGDYDPVSGVYAYIDDTTALYYGTLPANPQDWSAGAFVVTKVSSKWTQNGIRMTRLKNRWFVTFANGGVAFSNTGDVSGTYTEVTSANVSTAVGGTVVSAKSIGGRNYFATISVGYRVTSFADGVDFSDKVIHPLGIAAFENAGDTNGRWPIRTNLFANTSPGTELIGIRHGKEDLAIVTSQSLVKIVLSCPGDADNNSPVYKFGQWWSSTVATITINTTPQFGKEAACPRRLTYRGGPGGWVPSYYGWGHVVDADVRLLRMNGSGQLLQTTDGETWTSTGITQPTITATVGQARLWRVGDVIFYYTANANYSGEKLYVSTDFGLTWATPTLLPAISRYLALPKGTIVRFKGYYFAVSCDVTAQTATGYSPTAVDRFLVYRSVDGVNWTIFISTIGLTAGQWNDTKTGGVISDGRLYFNSGFYNSTTPSVTYSTPDGTTINTTFTTIHSDMANYTRWDVNCAGPEIITSRQTLINGQIVSTVRVGGAPEFNVVSINGRNVGSVAVGDYGELLATNMLGLQWHDATAKSFAVPLPAGMPTNATYMRVTP